MSDFISKFGDTELERNVKKKMYHEQSNLQEEEEKFVLMENGSNIEQTCREIIRETMLKSSLTKESLYQNEKVMRDIIRKLKQEGISYRMIEKIFGMNRKKNSRRIKYKEKRDKNHA